LRSIVRLVFFGFFFVKEVDKDVLESSRFGILSVSILLLLLELLLLSSVEDIVVVCFVCVLAPSCAELSDASFFFSFEMLSFKASSVRNKRRRLVVGLFPNPRSNDRARASQDDLFAGILCTMSVMRSWDPTCGD